MSAESQLEALHITLPPVPAAAGLYSPCVQTGSLLIVSGQVAVLDGKLMGTGKLGAGVSIEDAAAMARQCALQALAIVRSELGSLDRVNKVARVAGYVACAEGFTDPSKVVNGASQLLIDVFGEPGRAARIAIGVAELPFGVPVEVEFMFETREQGTGNGEQ